MKKIFKAIKKLFGRNTAKNRKEKKVDYAQYIKSGKWKSKRKKVLERDNYTCQHCQQVGNKKNNWLEVHHLTYKNLGNERLKELLTLCVDCHKAVHRRKND